MVISSYIIDFLNAKASSYSASGGKNPYMFVLASTYSASGGKNPYFFVFSGCKTQNMFLFKLSLQPWDLARKMRLEKLCLQR